MKPLKLKAIIQILIFCLVFAGLVMPGAQVSAAMRGCRTDPILTFSDGTKLTVSSTIDANVSSITSVVYTVHSPTGVALIKTVFTMGGLGGREKVVAIADQKPGVYRIDTLVTTLSAGIHVTTYADFKTLSASVAGTSGNLLVMTLAPKVK